MQPLSYVAVVLLACGLARALPLADEKCVDGNSALCRKSGSASIGQPITSQEHLLLQFRSQASLSSGHKLTRVADEAASDHRNAIVETNATREPLPWGSLPRPTVQVQGRQLLVDGQPLHIKGIDWSPTAKGEDRADRDWRRFLEADVAMMSEAGINAVRVYDPLSDRLVLDILWEKRIFVVPTVYMSGDLDVILLKDEVNRVRDHPAILMWALGNEWNYQGFYIGLSHDKCVENIKTAVAAIREHDDSRPIATVYGGMPPKWAIDQLPEIDVWGLNYYHGLSFEHIFEQWEDSSEKPMYLAEYGADAWNANKGEEDDTAQADATLTLTADIVNHSSVLGGVCLGGFLFEWSDEWWKDRTGSLDTHDVGGIAPGGGPWPDLTFNEEWWGIVDIDRNPRAAYYAYKDVQVPTLVLPSSSMTSTSAVPTTSAPSTTTIDSAVTTAPTMTTTAASPAATTTPSTTSSTTTAPTPTATTTAETTTTPLTTAPAATTPKAETTAAPTTPAPSATTTVLATTAAPGSPSTSGENGTSAYPQAMSVVSTWSIWKFEEMTRDAAEPSCWYLDAHIRYPHFEEFQIVVDHDWTKVIHPKLPLAEDDSVPIVGPDATGTGYNFLIRGPVGDKVRIKLRFDSPADMDLEVVNVTYPDMEPKKWHTWAPASSSD